MHQVKIIELSTDEFNETFLYFDAEIHHRLRHTDMDTNDTNQLHNIGQTCWKNTLNFLRSL